MQVTYSYNADEGTKQRTHDLLQLLSNNLVKTPIATIRRFLEHGVDIKAEGSYYSRGRQRVLNALQMAIEQDNVPAVSLLLEYGMDGEERDISLYTPLMVAVQNGSTDVINLLLSRGVSVWAETKEGKTTDKIDKYYSFASSQQILQEHRELWRPHYDDFCKGEYTPQTPADWLGLASVMPLSDPQAYSSVADRVAQLMDWHKGLKALRTKAASPTIGGLEV